MRDSSIIDHIILWDIKNWSRFILFCEKYLPNDSQGRIALEIGARQGGLSLYLALKGFTVICSDLYSPEQTANIIHAQYSVRDKIKYKSIDVLNINYPDNFIDLVAFKSVLGGLNDKEKQRRVFNEIYRILKPNGFLIFAENATGTLFHHFMRKIFTPRLSYWRYVTLSEIREYSKIFRHSNLESYGFFGFMGWNEKVKHILGCLDSLVNRFIPESWKYIIFGYFIK